MSSAKRFTCLTYRNINFLIPNEQICTASCCDDSSFITDDREFISKVLFSGQQLDFIDFDDCVRLFDTTALPSQIRTTIIIKNNHLFDDNSKYYGLLTSTDCKVQYIDEELLIKPSGFYKKLFAFIGIDAVFFRDDKVFYQLDINKFLGNIHEKSIGS